jgi:iduronate 2-sulfatase
MTRAYTQFALCGPSRTSFLTSRQPEDMHVLANRNLNWRQNWKTKDVYSLPQYFKRQGYRTKSIGKIFHPIGRKSGNPDDNQLSWTDPPYFVDPIVNYFMNL